MNCTSVPTPAPMDRVIQLTDIFTNRRPLLKGIANSILRNDADAEDALQEAYYKALNHINQLADDRAILGWLCMIVRNHSLQMLRSRRVRRAGSLDSEPEVRFAVEAIGTDSSESPEHLCIEQQSVGRVLARLDKLPVEMRAAVKLHYLSEMSLGEISEVQGKSIAALKSYLYRGRKILRGAQAPPRESASYI